MDPALSGRPSVPLGPDEPLRAAFRRVNVRLGTNKNLSLKDVQVILGHAHLPTTADGYLVEDELHITRRVRQHLHERALRGRQQPLPAAAGYDRSDLAVLFGEKP